MTAKVGSRLVSVRRNFKNNMKSTKTNTASKEDKFPSLFSYKDDSFIVLFSSPRSGTVVWSEEEAYKAGHHDCGWNLVSGGDWKLFDGKITLQN